MIYEIGISFQLEVEKNNRYFRALKLVSPFLCVGLQYMRRETVEPAFYRNCDFLKVCFLFVPKKYNVRHKQ